MKNEKIWYELDAFAKTYSSIISEGRTTCFRLSALFTENIDIKILKEVSNFLEKKYPFYNSELKKGIFWNYLQQKKTHFMIRKEVTYPCTDIRKDNPLRIIYFNNKISIEIAHFLTDGKGALLFFQDLIEKYLEEKYFCEKTNFQKIEEILESSGETEKIKKNEYVDLYEKYLKKVSKETTIKSAFHLPIKILETTYRNFFINITPSVDASLGAYSLSEIITYLDNYFALKITKKEFYKSIYKAMNPIGNMIIKSVPYLIKRLFFPFIFDYYGERGYTTGFSNLGIFKIDKKYEKFLKGLRFLPPPSKRCKIKMGVISDNQKIYVNFGNLTANYDIERDFFIYLRKRGIKSKIITNY